MCAVALVIQHAKRIRSILLSSVAFPAAPYFATLFNKKHNFQEKKLCVLIIWNISHSK